MSVLKVKENGAWKDIPTIVGEAAGFGTVTATVDTNVGTPAVVVTSSGEDTAKNFAFQFKNLGYDDSELQNDFDVLQGQFDTAVAAVTTDTEVTDIRVGADGVTDTTAGASVRRQFTDAKSALNILGEQFVCPVFYRTSISGTQFVELSCNIPAGKYTINIDNIVSSDTDETTTRVIFYNGSTSLLDVNFDRGQHIEYDYIFSANVTKIYIYASTNFSKSAGDTFAFSGFGFLDNTLKKKLTTIPVVDDVLTLPISYYDGYYSSWGSVETASDTYKEKYTEKIPCYSGLKLRFRHSLPSISDVWLAICEWDGDGTFTRVTQVNTRAFEVDYTYEPASTVAYVSFTFRSISSSSVYSVSLASNLTDYLNSKAMGASASGVTYNFCRHTIKGVNHRGYNPDAPENTIPAFRLSVNKGFKFVETDVRFTSDNVPVLLHDATVDRTSNGSGNIADMTYAQARALDFGSWKSATYAGTKIPSFEEFIIFCRNVGAYPYIEISSGILASDKIKTLVDIVNKYGMLRSVTWISFYIENLQTVVTLDRGARVGFLPSTFTDAIACNVDMLKTGINDVFVDIYYTDADDAISICKNHNLPLEVWVVNSQAIMEALDNYISGATSDYLDFESVISERDLS